MEIPRKIQLTGRNTYIVSLPHEWVANKGVKKGDAMYLVENSDGTITLSLKQTNRELKTCTINVSINDSEAAMRNIVSAYVGGAGRIAIKGKGTSTVAEEARRVLSGVEITEENGDELILRILAFDDLDIDGIIKREYNVTNSMFGVVISRYQEDVDVRTEISRKEDDVDRLYLLLLRNVCLGAGKSREVVFKTIAAKSIEKISDHLEDICLSATSETAPNEAIVQLLQIAQQMCGLSYSAFIDGQTDNLEYTTVKKKYNDLIRSLDEKIKKDKNQSKMLALKTLIEKCNKLTRYTEDILESSCDLAFAKES